MSRVRAAVCRPFGEPLAAARLEPLPPGVGEVAIGACAACRPNIAFVAAGATPAFDGAPSLLAPDRRVVLARISPSGEPASYRPDIDASAGQTPLGAKTGNTVPARKIPRLAGLCLQGRLKLDELTAGR